CGSSTTLRHTLSSESRTKPAPPSGRGDCSPKGWRPPRSTAPDDPPVAAPSTGRLTPAPRRGGCSGSACRRRSPARPSAGGSLWGVVTVNAERELRHDTEERLENFTELVTTAIANAEAGIAVRAAADEQGALRRVATLVAASAAPSDVFTAVTQEIALVLGADATLLCRSDPDGAAVVVGSWGDTTPRLGTRIPPGGRNLTTILLDPD